MNAIKFALLVPTSFSIFLLCHPLRADTATSTGTAGTTSNLNGGAATATSSSSTSTTDRADNSSTATGGAGVDTGTGGNATATSTTNDSAAGHVTVATASQGGAGGSASLGEIPGAGGSAQSTSNLTLTNNQTGTESATATGGAGGAGYTTAPSGGTGAAGGSATVTLNLSGIADTSSALFTPTATATGGAGGAGSNFGDGGAGGSSHATMISPGLPPNTTISLTSIGGAGGDSIAGAPGAGGGGNASIFFGEAKSGIEVGTATAEGGNAGDTIAGDPFDASGGEATANSEVQIDSKAGGSEATAVAIAQAGAGGTRDTTVAGPYGVAAADSDALVYLQGTAQAESVASGNVTKNMATATIDSLPGQKFLGATATVSANPGSEYVTQGAYANSYLTQAGTALPVLSLAAASQNLGAFQYTSLAPQASDIAAVQTGNARNTAAFSSTGGSTLVVGLMGFIDPTAGAGNSLNETIDLTLNFPQSASYSLGLTNFSYSGTGTLDFTVLAGGATIYTESFASFADAASFFDDNVLALPAATQVTIELGGTAQWTSGADSDAAFNFEVGNAVPEPSAVWLLLGGLGALAPMLRLRNARAS